MQRSGSIWDLMQSKGYSRRDFLQFCGYAAAVGISRANFGAVAQAFEKKPRPNVVWMHFQECTCCSESFLRSSHPIVADILLDKISLDYTETLLAAAGTRRRSACRTPSPSTGASTSCWSRARCRVDGGVYC